jgi:hypothetical protein
MMCTMRLSVRLLSALLVASAVAACGKTGDTLTSEGRDGAGGSRIDAGDGSVGVDGTGSVTGTGGSAGAGGLDGTGGFIGTGSSPGAGGNPNDLALNTLDPHADERKRAVHDLCSLLTVYPCLSYSGSIYAPLPSNVGKDLVLLCEQEMEWRLYSIFGASCWDEWLANAKCGLARTDYCPCTGNDCFLTPGDPSFGTACSSSQAALQACGDTRAASGEEIGARTCSWRVDSVTGCFTSCSDDPELIDMVKCQGPPNGAQACTCEVNGVFLGDIAQQIQLGYFSSWLADDCQNVARQMATGKCHDILNCCATWMEPATDGGAASQGCGCTADPTQAGIATCDALAKSVNGSVVDVCPQYRPASPFPGSR